MFKLVLEKAEEPEIKLPTSAATATAKSLQSCPTLCNPIDGSPPGSAVPGILKARILEWVAIAFSEECSNYHTIAVISHTSKSNALNSPSQASAIREP